MKIFKVHIHTPDGDVDGTDVDGVTLEGVKAFDRGAVYDFAASVAEKLYGWNGPGMVIAVIQTGEESRL